MVKIPDKAETSVDPVLDRLREMFGFEPRDADGVFEELDLYDRHMHRTVARLQALVDAAPSFVPWGSINVITEADGHESCNHPDSTSCTRTGHVTESLYRRIPGGSQTEGPTT